MYKKILVPLDGSELAKCVLPHVESLIRGGEAKEIVFARVYERFRYPAGTGEVGLSPKEIERIDSMNRNEAEKYLRNVVQRFQWPGVTSRCELLEGGAAESLAQYSKKQGIDLVVIATHGRSGVSRWVWGSVADRLLRSVCIPVLMVRAPGCAPGI